MSPELKDEGISRMRSVTLEATVTALLLALGLYGVYASSQMQMSLGSQIGPGVFPLGATTILAVLAGIQLWLTLRKSGDAEPELEPPPTGHAWRSQAVVLVSLFLAVILMNKIGYLATMFALISTGLWVFRERRPMVVVAVALAVTLISFLLFAVVLGVRMRFGPAF